VSEAQETFEARRQSAWRTLETLLREDAAHILKGEVISQLTALYRSVTSDLMHARAAGYSSELIDHLHTLAARGHARLYSTPPKRASSLLSLLRADFPGTVRRHRVALWVASALFVLPSVFGLVTALGSREIAVSLLDARSAEAAATMYAQPMDGRPVNTNAQMAGFYINNNISVAFRCFAGGILFCAGSAFFLVFNGLNIGAFSGLVTLNGHGENLLSFVCGHSAFELTAIVLSGQAGLVMGYALVATGGLTRWGSLRAQVRDIANIVLGATFFLVIAAFIEGFWSPSAAPPVVKYVVAAALWSLVFLYLSLAGRGPRAERQGLPS